MFKKTCLALGVSAALILFASCGKKDSSGGAAPADAHAQADKKADAKNLADGKWPAAVYSKYGIDEITTKGKVVYTELVADGPYQYQVDYHGVTQDELKAWVDHLLSKGCRIHDRDKERLSGKYDHDTMIYFAGEKQPYRMRLSYDFSKDMEMEYYTDSPNPAFTVTERGSGDDVRTFIVYNLSISLNPLKTAPEISGSFDSLGIKADDLKGNDNVRAITMSENANGGTMQFRFYSDHLTTKAEYEECRDRIADKLAEKGCTFSHAMSGEPLTAADLKAKAIGSYMVEKNGKKYLVMVDNNSEFNEYGGSYGVRLMLKK